MINDPVLTTRAVFVTVAAMVTIIIIITDRRKPKQG